MSKAVQILAATAIGLLVLPSLAVADIAGSEDHPITGRFEGSEIRGYDTTDFDVYTVHDAQDMATLEGAITEIAYTLPEGISIVAAARNFEKRLTDQRFDKVFDCYTKTDNKACSRDLAYGAGQLPIPQMSVDPFHFSYQLYRSVDQGSTYVAVLTSHTNGQTYLQVSVIEIDDLNFQVVDAKQISDQLASDGQIALYGIQFDTDSADIKTESRESLAELGAYLTNSTASDILIVGHTDNQGSLAYNMDLSARRAMAVRDYVAGEFGVDGNRLQAEGVGFLAPVASNQTSEGRALNRRVVIVPK